MIDSISEAQTYRNDKKNQKIDSEFLRLGYPSQGKACLAKFKPPSPLWDPWRPGVRWFELLCCNFQDPETLKKPYERFPHIPMISFIKENEPKHR